MVIHNLQESVSQGRLSSLVLPSEENGFRTIAPLHSNVRALEATLLFATNHQSFVALTGPSGCGKSLLLNAAHHYIKTSGIANVEYMTAEQFLKMEGRIGLEKTLVLDDCQHVLGKPKQCLRLRIALDRRVRGNRPTLVAFATTSKDRRIQRLLPNPRKWCLENIGEPDLAGRITLVQHLARVERLNLSPTFAKIIGARLLGNGRVVAGALRRLKLEKNEWTDSHQVLLGCGLLDPYFADNSHWDLKHRIMRTATEASAKEERVESTDLACYLMIQVAGLCESSVAIYLETDPSQCYQKARKVAKQVRSDASIASLVQHCTESILGKLA